MKPPEQWARELTEQCAGPCEDCVDVCERHVSIIRAAMESVRDEAVAIAENWDEFPEYEIRAIKI